MSKMKDLVTDVTFLLEGIQKVQVGSVKVDVFTYTCEENGAVVKLHPHPTQVRGWVICEGTNEMGHIVSSVVVEALAKLELKRKKNQSLAEIAKEIQL